MQNEVGSGCSAVHFPVPDPAAAAVALAISQPSLSLIRPWNVNTDQILSYLKD